MKQTKKNSSKQVNNEVLNVETIKATLKAACVNMNAAQTKEYIKGLDGYEIRLTGRKPTQHYTVFYGEVRVCNIEQVQGIKADGTSRRCVSTAKVNFIEKIEKTYKEIREKLFNDMTDDEKIDTKLFFDDLKEIAEKIQSLFDSCNNRIAAAAAAAAKLKRDTEKGKKVAEKLDNSTLLQVLIAKGINEVEAKKLLNIA